MIRISLLWIMGFLVNISLFPIDFPYAGTIRSYKLHVPAGITGNIKVPLILVLHGGGGTADKIEKGSCYNEIADREKSIVVYPQGYKNQWNDGRNVESIPTQRLNTDDVGFINALIDTLCRHYPVDIRRIYATGPSNGGFMSTRLGCELGNKLAAIAPVISTFPKQLMEYCHPVRPMPVLLINGTADPLVPYNGGFVSFGKETRGEVLSTDETISFWVNNNKCNPAPVKTTLQDPDKNDGCWAEKYVYKGSNDGGEVILIRINGGGHTIPGGKQYMPKRMVGNVCGDFVAEEMIWEFFKSHEKL
jgi:polyhydroxybutyrate depolymerase